MNSPKHNPIGYRLRRDIAWQSQVDGRSPHPIWIAEDSLTRRIFRCGEHEYRLLHWLDSESTFEAVQDRFNAEFAPRSIDVQQIHELIAKCDRSGMLRSVSPRRNADIMPYDIWPQANGSISGSLNSRIVIAEQLRSRQSNWILQFIRWLGSAIGKLAQTQMSLGSPDRWLVHLAPKLGWLYSGTAIWLWMGTSLFVCALVGLRFDVFLMELPDFQSLRSPAFIVGYGVIFVLTRILHELGHAVVCKRAGAACKDAGLIFSFGLLCPYVDITDAWRIGSRTTRIGIALAGIYTEGVLAFFAALLWLTTHPGGAHDLAMQTLLVCSVTTLLFNANPLMKYDGYFVLCDWLNTQNLMEKSFEALDAILDGRARRDSAVMSFFLVLYCLGASVNRVLLIAGLATMVYFVASQWQMAGLGLGLIVLYGCCSAITMMAAWSLTKTSGVGTRKISRRTAWLGWIAVSLLNACAVNMPLPGRTYSIGVLHLGDRQPVYTSLAGRITSLPSRIDGVVDDRHGVGIEQESMILTLENPAIQKQVFELESKLMRMDGQLETIERSAYFDTRALASLPTLVSQRALVSKQLERKKDEQQGLTVLASTSGWFESAKSKPAESLESPMELALGLGATSHGSNSSEWTCQSSIGRHVDRGTLIGWIVQDQGATIECRLTEEQIAGISTSTQVRFSLAQDPTTIFTGRVVEIAKMSQAVGLGEKIPKQYGELQSMTHQVKVKVNENRVWPFYTNGNADVVFIKPSQSIVAMVIDKWMRDSKLR